MSRSSAVVQRTRGPVVPLNICFDDDAGVDFGAVRGYVDWLCENGAPILLLTYGSSEYAYLSDDDVWRLTAEVADVNAGRALFVAATGWWSIPSVPGLPQARRRGRSRRREGAGTSKLPD